MEKHHLPSAAHDVMKALQICGQNQDPSCALQLYVHIAANRPEVHASHGKLFVSSLVGMGSMHHAQQAFDGLRFQDERSWNCLITGYVKHGQEKHALIHYKKLEQKPHIRLADCTFVSLLKACRVLKDLETGCRIHDHVLRTGLPKRNIYVGSALVDMYAKCGSLVKAQETFDQLEIRNAVSWTVLIAGYVEHGDIDVALNCFGMMQCEGISPDPFTLVCILKACAAVGATEEAQEIHAEIARQDLLAKNVYIGSILVDMYIKSGLLSNAEEVFEKLPTRNVVSWNAIIGGYVEHGHPGKAFDCRKWMQNEGISGDAFTLVSCLKACNDRFSLEDSRELHCEIVKKGFLENDLFCGGTLVETYAKCGCIQEACAVFEVLPIRSMVSWNAIIAGHAEYGYQEEAFSYFELMQHMGIGSDQITYLHIIRVCRSTGDIRKGHKIHTEIVTKGLETLLPVGNSLVDMYAKVGFLTEAQAVFNKLPVQNIVSWTALMTGCMEHGHGKEALYCLKQMECRSILLNAVSCVCALKACSSMGIINVGQTLHTDIIKKGLMDTHLLISSTLIDMYAKCGMLEEAHDIFDKVPDKDVVSCTALMIGYAEQGYSEEALDMYDHLQNNFVSPDVFTFTCGLTVCSKIGALSKGWKIHVDVIKQRLENDTLIGNYLVDMYAKCGSLTSAENVFNTLPVKEISSWNAMIAGYAQLGEKGKVFSFVDMMRREGLHLNCTVHLSILNVCNYAGLIQMAIEWIQSTNDAGDSIPTLEQFTCVIDMLGRAGQVEVALHVIDRMPFHPTVVTWHTMLGACQKRFHLAFGIFAFEQALSVNQQDAASYVCLSNIYGYNENLKLTL